MKKLLLISLLLLTTKLFSQACCTSGTPLLSSLETASTPLNKLQFGLSLRYNSIASLYFNDERLDDNTRKRVAKSVILQTDYGIWKNISISALFSFVMQERKIKTQTISENLLNSTGIGDALFLIKYNIIPINILDEIELSAGGGIKLPLGESQLTSDGLLIPADMQPGTGSLDYLGWIYFSKGRLFSLPLNLVSNISYRINRVNNRFKVDNFNYQFGNETIAQIGLAYRTYFISDFSVFLRYRNAQPDLSQNFKIPTTGGSWFYIVPGINFKFDDSKTIRFSSEIPIYIKVNGTQLTTSFSTTLAFYYSLNL
ncbi:MAG: hypothetical protein PF445_01015 [Melioribacteraceae bacterium]|jgi:hypothetical protein|nr:hypothetical protein [Melioribacteraceae bacterium]